MLDVLSESADDEIVEDDIQVSHISDVHSPGLTKDESLDRQACAIVDKEDHNKGM